MSINNTDRRILPDRRKRPTPMISRYTFIGGQRKTIRRESDRRRHLFVDLYSPHLLIIFLALLLFSYLDAYFTLTLINHDFIIEANPFMALYLENGIAYFIVNKFLLTALSIFILCIFNNISIARIGLRFLVMVYLSVITYQLYLMYKVVFYRA